MRVQILCRSPGMRRCGVEHPPTVTYPADRWTDAELDQFRADPAFEVIEVADEAPAAPADSADRIEALRAAIADLKEADFTQTGRPKVAVLEAKLGFKPTAEEVDAAMAVAPPAADAAPAEAASTEA
tara:strand:- start:74 stop:454 length:381 start_codon:yes stop_codon:yes gene_type:complete